MRDLFLIVCGLMAFCLSVAPAGAEDHAPAVGEGHAPAVGEGTVLSWSDVLERVQFHPDIAVAEDDVAAQAGEVKRRGQYPNPEVGLSAGKAVSKEDSESAFIWGVALEIPLLSPGTFANGKRAAKAQLEASKLDVETTRRVTIAQLRSLFLDAGLAQGRVKVLEASGKQLERLVEVAKVRLDKGVARPQELTRMEIEREKLRVELDAAKISARVGRKTLALWLRLEENEELRVDAKLSELPSLPELEGALVEAKTSHPTIRAAVMRQESAASTVKAEKNVRFPEMAIGGFFESELDANMMGAMFSVALPVWNWNTGGVAQAKALETQAQHQAELAVIELEVGAREAHAAAEQALTRARAYKDVIVPKERGTLADLEQMYKVGEVGVMEILYSRQSQIDTEIEMLEALYAAHLAHTELVILIGANDDDR